MKMVKFTDIILMFICYFAVLLLSVVTWQAMAVPNFWNFLDLWNQDEPLKAVSRSVNAFATNFFKVKINSLHLFVVPGIAISFSSSSGFSPLFPFFLFFLSFLLFLFLEIIKLLAYLS